MLRYNFYTDRYWVSLKEFVLFVENGATPESYSESSFLLAGLINVIEHNGSANFNASSQGNGFNAFETLFKWSSGSWILKDYIADLWNFLKHRYEYEFVFDVSFGKSTYLDNPYTSWTSDELAEYYKVAQEFLIRFLGVMERSYERYALILKTYADNKADLLNKVESLTRFNDTPQDTGEFSDDEHTTHITSTKNDFDTLMGRIDEIDRKYRNVLADWTREFESLFIHEESL